ncbi:MAG TPA: shikimate kinase [Pyrinomonadaceae bacterium]|nr:shikimate kinase [Pyrinomonadaceae bacterium]
MKDEDEERRGDEGVEMRDEASRRVAGSPRRVVIVGFMCAGKTNVARELARRLGCAWADMDERIAARAGRTPRELIEEEGEEAFREVETRVLAELLGDDEGARVVAAGGGTWTLERNRALLARHGCLSVWLDAPFELCWQRIEREGGAASRPLARDAASARRLYDERLPVYRLADLRVNAFDGRTPDALAEEVAEALHSSARELKNR